MKYQKAKGQRGGKKVRKRGTELKKKNYEKQEGDSSKKEQEKKRNIVDRTRIPKFANGQAE